MSNPLDSLDNALKNLNLSSALRDLVVKSMAVPQIGPYHLEGPTLRSHLEDMLRHTRALLAPNALSANHVEQWVADFLIEQAVLFGWENLAAFDLLHDLGKMSCMQATLNGDEELEFDLDGWLDLDDETKARVIQISYIGHDRASGEILAETGYDNELVTKIVTNHMSAVLGFEDGVNITLFEKNFGGNRFAEDDSDKPEAWTEEEIHFLLLTRYLDQAASWRETTKPDLSGFMNLYQTWMAWLNYWELMTMLQGQRVNWHNLQRDLDILRKSPDAFQGGQTAKHVFDELMTKHGLPEVDETAVREALADIDGLPPELLEMVVANMVKHGQLQRETGKALGRQWNQLVRKALRNLGK